MLFTQCHITPMATFCRERVLPVFGEVRCQAGERVNSDHVIAFADRASGFRLLNLDELLGTSITDGGKVLVKRVGETVEKGEIIARTRVLFGKACVSPVRGTILDARLNKVLIEVASERVELRAFFPGQVIDLIPGRGAEIEVTGALIQGVWGSGAEQRGRLELVVPDGETPLTADRIVEAHMGTILIGGRTLDAGAVAQAVRNQVRGVIVGSITSSLLSIVRSSPLSLIVTEGFGSAAMNPGTFALLRSYASRDACFSPAVKTRWDVRRPEVVIPLRMASQPASSGQRASLSIGTQVRALRAPYENHLGQVVSLPPSPRRLASGIQARGAEVVLESVGRAFIPFENLEIVL